MLTDSDLDYAVPSRERTLSLLRICLATYPSCQDRTQHGWTCDYSDGVMGPIWSSGESIFHGVANQSSADTADQSFHEQTLESIRSAGGRFRDVSAPRRTAPFDIGVAASEWTIGTTTILAFRGTVTDGDDDNIENWITDYILEKSTDQMHSAWTNDAKLRWTPIMQKRARRSDAFEKLVIRSSETYFSSRTVKDRLYGEDSFPEDLVKAVSLDANLSAAIGGMTKQEAQATGYWKITKHIVEDVVKNMPNENSLVLTGHSQGGTRAQFAAMYLNKTRGWNPPTVTFAATGSSCAARQFFSNFDILEDVNPFIQYKNMVDYVHPLDPWGNAMLGVDNGESVCFFGTKKVQEAEASNQFDGAYKYCSRVYGWSGPTVLVARSGISGPRGPKNPHELDRDFARCRYFTHYSPTMLLALEESLNADGIPDGGCRSVPVIPKNDPGGLCPSGRVPFDEEIFGLEFVILFVVLMFILCFGISKCCRRCCGFWRGRSVHVPRAEFEPLALVDDGNNGSTIELPPIA